MTAPDGADRRADRDPPRTEVTTPDALDDDLRPDASLRPQRLDDPLGERASHKIPLREPSARLNLGPSHPHTMLPDLSP